MGVAEHSPKLKNQTEREEFFNKHFLSFLLSIVYTSAVCGTGFVALEFLDKFISEGDIYVLRALSFLAGAIIGALNWFNRND